MPQPPARPQTSSASPDFILLEVKSHTDQVRRHQLAWLERLHGVAACGLVNVRYTVDGVAKPPRKPSAKVAAAAEKAAAAVAAKAKAKQGKDAGARR